MNIIITEDYDGCEAWRDLDWMNDDEKVLLECSKHKNIAWALSSMFETALSVKAFLDSPPMPKMYVAEASPDICFTIL